MSRAVPRFKRINALGIPVGAGVTTVQYKIVGSLESQMTVSTFAYRVSIGTPSATQLQAGLLAISTALFTAYKACLSSDWTCTLERLDVTSVNNLNGQTRTANAGAAGSRGTPHLPTQMAAVMTKNSQLKGQHGRGRVSLPGIAAADVTQSTITAAALSTAMDTLGTAIYSIPNDGLNNWQPIIPQRAIVSPRLVVGYADVSGSTKRLLLGTVRRRKIGRGKYSRDAGDVT